MINQSKQITTQIDLIFQAIFVGFWIIGGSVSGKTNVLLNLIKHQRADIEKIYLYVEDPLESKDQ